MTEQKLSRRRAISGRPKIEAEMLRLLKENRSKTMTVIFGELRKADLLRTYSGGEVSEATIRRWAQYLMTKHRLQRIPKTVHITQLLLADKPIPEIAEFVGVQESTVYAVFCSNKRKFNDRRSLKL